MQIIGYADRFSVEPGETLDFMVSAETDTYEAAIVRLIQGDDRPEGPGYLEEEVPSGVAGSYSGQQQVIRPGSYMRVQTDAQLDLRAGLTVQCWLFPTDPKRGPQGIVTQWSDQTEPAWGLVVDDAGCLALWLKNDQGELTAVRCDLELRQNLWHFVACTYDPQTGLVRIVQDLVAPPWSIGERRAAVEETLAHNTAMSPPELPVLLAAFHETTTSGEHEVAGFLDGRLDAPKIFARALSADEVSTLARREPHPPGLAAHWDFSQDMGSAKIQDISGNAFHGTLINAPMRAVRGSNWDGTETTFRLAPDQYGAVHFHRDDLEDAGWEVNFSLQVPAEWPSGVYAARLRGADDEEYVPFFVRPRRGTRTAPVAFIVPTLSYIAYANEHYYRFPFQDWSRTSDRPIALSDHDRYIEAHPEVGLSTYDLHADGSGTACYSSRLRPILNMRPKQVQYWTRAGRHFVGDLYLVSWLEHFQHEYDVVTDEDLHNEGVDLLERYRAVILGHHHEYWTWNMRQALGAYIDAGGRVMNLGGNQLWWVVGIHEEKPHLIEVRKEDFTYVEPIWGTHPAERYLSTTGEQGGTWRLRGLDPAQLLATSFSGEGWDVATAFYRKPDGNRPEVAFIFDGIGEDEPIGDFGLAMRGAAGDEYDRVYFSLGAPPHTLTLAASAAHSDRDTKSGFAYQPREDESERVRTDLAYYEMENGGAVFSAASMCWDPALPWNGYDNNVSRITNNVLKEFLGRPSALGPAN